MLADTTSCLVEIDPDHKQHEELQGCEFGYYLFDTLPPIEINEVVFPKEHPKVTVTDPQGHELTLANPYHTKDEIQHLVDGLEGDHYEIILELQSLDPSVQNTGNWSKPFRPLLH